jgi:menaquinone-dependent protoporphyrinogen oxidase
MHVLVTAASRHEASGDIAVAIAHRLAELGLKVDARPIEDVSSLEGYDAVVLGSAVYVGRWLNTARTFAEHHAGELTARPLWLFSSGPLGPPENLMPAQEPADIPSMMKLTGARGHRVFAGRLDLRRLGLAERTIVRRVHAPAGDSRDWDAIEVFADEIARWLLPVVEYDRDLELSFGGSPAKTSRELA